MKTTLCALALAVCASFTFSGCGGGDGTSPIPVKSGGGDNKIVGGGSTFVFPCMSKWTNVFHKKTKIQVNYQSLGSSGGVNQFLAGTLDFAATDAPMKDEQLQKAGGEVQHIPVVMGAVAITYNLPELSKPLILSGALVADLYLGKIKKWNDPAIAGLNEGVALPDKEIVLVRRADGSGTTFILSDFLSQSSADWETRIGKGNGLNWPSDTIGEKGNEGVSARIQRNKYSIGYVELIYAIEAKMAVATLINRDGAPVAPSAEAVTVAAEGTTTLPEDLRISIVNAAGKGSYPMAGITWVVAKANTGDAGKAKLLKNFLEFVLSDTGQSNVSALNYSKLPKGLLEKARAKVAQIK